MTLLGFGSNYFEILAKALIVEQLWDSRNYNIVLNVKRLFMIGFFSGLSVVFSSNFNFDVIGRVWSQYHKLEFCKVRFHSIIITKQLNSD